MLLRPENKFWYAHIFPFYDFEPLPLYNHVHVPATNYESLTCSFPIYQLLYTYSLHCIHIINTFPQSLLAKWNSDKCKIYKDALSSERIQACHITHQLYKRGGRKMSAEMNCLENVSWGSFVARGKKVRLNVWGEALWSKGVEKSRSAVSSTSECEEAAEASAELGEDSCRKDLRWVSFFFMAAMA